jgi:Caspase domain
LTSAAKDARFFCAILKAYGVERDHIHLLVDDDNGKVDQLPTREGILNTLHDLRENDNIRHDDTIIIWYSGRGASYHSNWYWPGTRSRVEALVPMDHPTEPDISDRELNLFLTDLASAKGNNITLVFDCCFACGGFRTGIGANATPCVAQRRVRIKENVDNNDLERMLEAAESNKRKSWEPGRALCHPSDWRADEESHVAIYASSENERACEDDMGGMLANALFRILVDEDLTSVSYRQLVKLIGSLGAQNPTVAGSNIDYSVFRIPQH